MATLSLLSLTALALNAASPPADDGATRGTATIRYDPGPDASNSGGPGPVVGNLFDSQFGQPLASGTIYSISAVIGSLANYGGRFVVAGPIVGSSAPFLASPVFPTDATGSVARATFPPLSVPNSFLVGFRPNLEQGLGVAHGTTQGQGFHGRYWYPYGGGLPATNIQVLTGQNAAIRVRGNVAVVPVELMEFDVE
jgi:hypothetical protein